MHGGGIMHSQLLLGGYSLCLASKFMGFQMPLLMRSLLGSTMGMAMGMASMAAIWDMPPMASTGKRHWGNSSRQIST